MTTGRAFRWALLIQGSLTLLATASWLLTGDWSFDVGVTFALVPNMVFALYLGYRLVRARIGEILPFVAVALTTAPSLIVGWSGYQALRMKIGREIGPMPVERYATLERRNAVVTWLTGRLLWQDGVGLELEQGGAKVQYLLLPLVPVSWKAGDPIGVWVLGTHHRLKRGDFNHCRYDPEARASPPCTIRLVEPRPRELRLHLIRTGVVPERGGMDFVVLRADFDPLFLPRWLALGVGPGWLLVFSLWLRRMGRRSQARGLAGGSA